MFTIINPILDKIELYTPGWNSDNKPFVCGPGNGMDYYSGYLNPHMLFTNEGDAKAAANCANEAYRQGYLKAQSDIRALLGL